MKRQSMDLLERRITARHQEDHPRPPSAAPAVTAPPAGVPSPAARRALRVLVVEGDARAAESLVQGLGRHGYHTESVASGAKALQAHHGADLILLDLDLPDLDGLEVCRGIRAISDTPIIAVTARGSELDRVLGLQAGSDDYMVKPYGFRELMARMEAVLRRAQPRTPLASVITRGPLYIDVGTRQVRLNGRPVELTRKEFDLLHLLAAQPENVISRRQVMAQVWDDSWSHPGRTIDTHVSSLRGKLGSSSWIITVRGVGFRLGRP